MSIVELNVIEDHERYKAELASVSADGKRKWIYARKPKGKYARWRSFVSVFLLAFLFLAPVVKVDGHQFLLFDVVSRQFVFFGVPFWPNDFYLVALLFLTGIVSIVVFTAVLGRIWCGWLCPQTVFLEMVFRKLEWLIEGGPKEQARRNAGEWNFDRTWRFTVKQALYAAISFLIANTFLAYFISTDTLLAYVEHGPIAHIELFLALLSFTAVFYLVFSRFREQACLIACPYGRYMSALVDENTIGVMYDNVRGEIRSKWKRHDQRATEASGHCIDCYQCVTVCPTGIDIRNGSNQLECVQCTGCIDACDEVMTRTGLPTGLIRYTSQAAIASVEKKWFTTRIKAYLAVWLVLIAGVTALLLNRTTLDIVLLRAPGTTWTVTERGVTNFYQLQIINKSSEVLPFSIEVVKPASASLTLLGLGTTLQPGEIAKGRFMIDIDKATVGNRAEIDVTLNIRSRGETYKTITTKLLAPQ